MSVFSSPLILLLISGLPLLLAITLMVSPARQRLTFLVPWVTLPALLLSLLLPIGIELELPWMLFGVQLGLDETARVFLLFSSVLWLVAGIYAIGYFSKNSSKPSFFVYFLLAMTGNFGLILAQEILLFFTFYALMSFASYGLVVHQRGAEALRAGRIYIILVVIGEVMLFAAFAMAASSAGSTEFSAVSSLLAESELKNVIMTLLFLGFGIKAGVIGLHVWLPLAHPVAPTPASAVLSGAMIAAGLLGWLRILPLGEAALPFWGAVMMVAGMAAAFYAVLVGLLQNNAKTVLAYSSISSMGIMTMAVGLGLIAPENWPFILSAILVYVLQHGLAKGALFLGVGLCVKPVVSRSLRYLLIVALLLPALSLAGAPLTSGLIAKYLLDMQLLAAVSPWVDWVQLVLPWSALAASLLLLRFLFLVWPQRSESAEEVDAATSTAALPTTMWLSWLTLVGIVVLSPWIVSMLVMPAGSTVNVWSLASASSALWSLALSITLAAAVWFAARYTKIHKQLRVPAGDIVIFYEQWLWPKLVSVLSQNFAVLLKVAASLLLWINLRFDSLNLNTLMTSLEYRSKQWTVVTSLLLLLVLVFVILASV